MKGGRQIQAQRFSFPTEALKVRKTKVEPAPWNFKDLSQITKDHIASQPKLNRDGGIFSLHREFGFIRYHPNRIIQTGAAEVC